MKVSVIVPVYNTGKFLKRCLESLCNQDFEDFEVIVIDDGSSDGSEKICDQFAKYDCMRIYHTKNHGRFCARNSGVEKSIGDYLLFVDSDDYVEKNYIRVLYEEAISKSAQIVECGMNIVIDGTIVEQRKSIYNSEYYDKDKIVKTMYPTMIYSDEKQDSGLLASLCNKLIKRDLFIGANSKELESVHCGEDGAVVFAMMLQCTSFVIVDYYLYNYVQNSTQDKQTFKEKDIQNIEVLYNYYCKEMFDVMRAQVFLYLGMNIIYLYFRIRDNYKVNLTKILNNSAVCAILKNIDVKKYPMKYRLIATMMLRKKKLSLLILLFVWRIIKR